MLEAMRDEVIVRPIYEEKRGTIIIPESAKQFKQYHGSIYGIVMSVGPDWKKKVPEELKPGDKVVWVRHEGKKCYEDGQLYFVLSRRWVIAKVVE